MPWFQFDLLYQDPVVASFEPTMTLLCKAYNLQHLDLSVPQEDLTTLRFSITFMVPPPVEYGNLTEYDIYSLYTENERFLPLLRQFKSAEKAEAGLIRLIPEVPGAAARDRFAIILRGAAGPTNHHGWLSLDPARFFDDFIKFKESVLIGTIG